MSIEKYQHQVISDLQNNAAGPLMNYNIESIETIKSIIKIFDYSFRNFNLRQKKNTPEFIYLKFI